MKKQETKTEKNTEGSVSFLGWLAILLTVCSVLLLLGLGWPMKYLPPDHVPDTLRRLGSYVEVMTYHLQTCIMFCMMIVIGVMFILTSFLQKKLDNIEALIKKNQDTIEEG